MATPTLRKSNVLKKVNLNKNAYLRKILKSKLILVITYRRD